MRGSWAAVLALDEPLNPLRDFVGRRCRFLNPCYHDFQPDLLSSRDFRSILSTRLSFEFENDCLNVKIGDIEFKSEKKLLHQQAGKIFLAAWNTDVDISSVEMICRDTIEWDE